MLEWLVAVPVVLLIGLAVIQWALVWQARHALEYAALRAAQVSATEHGSAQGVRAGLADGLGPLWGESDAAQILARIATDEASGALAWSRIWPPASVFDDFAEPAVDDAGNPIANLREIPNDNLRFRLRRTGAQSGLDLQQANQISIRVRYGVPLRVPLISSLIVRVMEIADGCSRPARMQLVRTDLGTPTTEGAARSWTCAMYRAAGQPGDLAFPRLPVQVAASARMQSTLREAGEGSGAIVPPAGGGNVPAADDRTLLAPEPTGPSQPGDGGPTVPGGADWFDQPGGGHQPSPFDDGGDEGFCPAA